MKAKVIVCCLWISVLLAGVMTWNTGSASAPAALNAEDTYVKAERALFYIRVVGNENKANSAGSGIVLSKGGTAVTAYHVVKNAGRIEGIFNDGTVVSPIKVVQYNETTDVAVLELPNPQAAKVKCGAYPFLPVRGDNLRFGEKVFALGYPLKNTPVITEGIVNNPAAVINGRERILTSAQVVSGMSGGPLIDEKGELAGVISGSLRTMDNIHLAADMDDLREVLPAVMK